jgi:hypothetical protein
VAQGRSSDQHLNEVIGGGIMTRRRKHTNVRRRRLGQAAALALAATAALATGCGSSKPAYCSAVANLESSIKSVPNTDVVTNGTAALKSTLQKVQSDAEAVVSAAKSDFPNETSALSSSVTTISTSIKQLPSSPAPAQVAQLAGQATAVITAAKDLKSATSSKCG